MFATAELGHTIPKKEFKQRELILRRELLDLQQSLRAKPRFPVIVLFAGVDGAGKGEVVNLLSEWMDPRWLGTCAYVDPSELERARPEYWRFWRDLPPKGRIGMFLSAWYSTPVLERVYENSTEAEFDQALKRIAAFERALADDGAVIIKFWMHLSRDAQKKRLKALEKDPLTRWRVRDLDWEHWRMYERFVETAEQAIVRTNTGPAAWHIVEGSDQYYRSISVGTIIRDTVLRHMNEVALADRVKAEIESLNGQAPVEEEDDPSDPQEETVTELPVLTVLSQLDMSQKLNKTQYKSRLKAGQARLNLLVRKLADANRSAILVFEGSDAAGKGGAIRRITQALDARSYGLFPFAAPTDEEAAQHYLWRFWRHVPPANGRVHIFDRSWYGRVLVERVEGFATDSEWRRAYAEINDFESQLCDHGIVLVKYWVHISKDEQLARFKDREQTEHKRWKLTDEDWRNREKWDLYELAANDLIGLTSTSQAPWHLVEGDDKPFARIKVLEILCESLETALGEKS